MLFIFILLVIYLSCIPLIYSYLTHLNNHDMKQNIPRHLISDESNWKNIQPPDLNISSHLNLNIVFYAYLPHDHDWKELLGNYLTDSINIGIYNRANKIYISLATLSNNDDKTRFVSSQPANDQKDGMKRLQDASKFIEDILVNYLDKLVIDVTLGNLYEYPGLLRVWETAAALPSKDIENTIILYYHSKGMVFHDHNESNKRQFYAEYFDNVIQPWKWVLKFFALDPLLRKAGIECAYHGGSRGNFFYIRASDVRRLKIPKRCDDRFYYEHWLSHMDENQLFEPLERFTLNFNFVEFRESHEELWRLREYDNGTCDGFWNINSHIYKSEGSEYNEII